MATETSSLGSPPVSPQPLQSVQPLGWAKPRGYSNGVVAPAGRRVLAVAGQIGWDAACKLVTPADGQDVLTAQFAQALRNVADIVRTAGGSVADVLSLRLYVTDKKRYLAQAAAIGAAYRQIFGRHYPAMALIPVTELLEDGALVEIEALAALA